MKLENLNLVELNAQEVQEIEGGWWLELMWHTGFHYDLGHYINNSTAGMMA